MHMCECVCVCVCVCVCACVCVCIVCYFRVSSGGYVRIISSPVAEVSSEVPTSGGNKGRKGSRTIANHVSASETEPSLRIRTSTNQGN